MKDVKLCIKKDEWQDLLFLIENEKIELQNKINSIYEKFRKEELSNEEKKDYFILQHSFILTHEENESLFVCNRQPIAFDQKSKRVTNGLSILLSASNIEKKKDSFDFLVKAIENKMLFSSFEKTILTEININVKYLGLGYNKVQNGATYIFLVYLIDIKDKNVFDATILSNKEKDNTIDVDYLFKIDKGFLYSDYGSYFMNKKADFDNCVLKSFNTDGNISTYNNAFFLQENNSNIHKLSINYGGDKITKLSNLAKAVFKKYLEDKFAIAEDVLHFSGEADLSGEILELVKCFYKVPMSIIRLQGN